MKERTYLIADPSHEYAMSLIDVIARQYGLRPVCVYLDSRMEVARRQQFPVLRSKVVLARYYLDHTTPAQLALRLQEKYEILGVVPYFEQSIGPMAELMACLNVRWNDPRVLARFRDKHALKQHLRAVAPEVPVGSSCLVHSAAEVLAQPLPERFVIKPNAGFGNRDVGFFAASEARLTVPRYFARPGGAAALPCVLEQQHEGTEYAINGQMDEKGEAIVVNVVEYQRCSANGVQNLYDLTHHVRRSDAAFAPLAAYARALMRATQLRRCPFHMEVMLTAEGPRLIEVGARFGGTRYAYMANNLHGGGFDYFKLAAHYYLTDRPLQEHGLNWEHYDRTSYVHVDGVFGEHARIFSLAGKQEIERLPEFCMWVIEPNLGKVLRPTVDVYSIPYSFQMMSQGPRDALVARARQANAWLQINGRVSVADRARVLGRARLESLKFRARYALHELHAALD